MVFQINKETMFEIYQNKIKFIPYKVMINTSYSEREFIENYKILYKNKLSSSNLNNFMFKVKHTFPSEKQVHDNNKKINIINFTLEIHFLFQFITFLYTIILSINPSVYLMFPDSLWIINVSYTCPFAPISPGTATYQGTHSHFYPLCTQQHFKNSCVPHPSGTSSDILPTLYSYQNTN